MANEAHPDKWNELDTTENDKRLSRHRFGPGSLVGAIMAPGAFAVFDVDHHGDDPAQWGDADALVESLAAAGVTVAARVATPGAGHHIYVPASPEYVCDIQMGGLRGFPGIEFKGKGNLYLPGSRRAKHGYVDYEVEFSELADVLADDLAAEVSVDALNGWLRAHMSKTATVDRAPDVDAPLPTHPSEIGEVHRQVSKAVTDEVENVHCAEKGHRDTLLTGTVFKLARYAYLEEVEDGVIISRERVRELMREACERNGLLGSGPDDLSPAEFDRKFDRQWSAGAAKAQRAVPFTPVGSEFGTVTGGSRLGGLRTEDRDVAEAIMSALKDRLVHTPGMGWLLYDSKRGAWRRASDARVLGLVMEEMAVWLKSAIDRATGGDFQKLAKLREDVKGRRVMSQVSTMVQQDDSEFDAHPDLLCVGNGVVDLKTGQLRAHDPALLLTKSTRTPYVPGAGHADWVKALESLPRDERDWFQGRIGQGITGHTPSDDRVVFMRNAGSGAKSTLMSALQSALGEHMIKVPEKVLTAKAEGHATELTELRGARLAYCEELPEGRFLNVKRLKDVAGTDVMDGRRMYRDTVRWRASHSLFLTTNYRPRIAESDHGTWRRLAMLEFPFTYVDGEEDVTDPTTQKVKDTNLRPNLAAGRDGRAEAVLAWAVEGARNWYAADRKMAPLTESVKVATDTWRGGEDFIKGFVDEFLEFDPTGILSTKELYAVFKTWRQDSGHIPLNYQGFISAFTDHELVAARQVSRGRVRDKATIMWHPDPELVLERDSTQQPYILRGVVWRTP
ncbi:phage/plasmid primase, P4 family [Kocuria carniphila]|uniref:phage/plasmid primase, P4 family n=1 Tax=Kocuria carniphila TaxID=262208 RepID=UPI0034CDF3E4